MQGGPVENGGRQMEDVLFGWRSSDTIAARGDCGTRIKSGRRKFAGGMQRYNMPAYKNL